MLYWGQQGITRDVQRAMKWYSRSAMELKHPASMFEYGLFLIKVGGTVECRYSYVVNSLFYFRQCYTQETFI